MNAGKERIVDKALPQAEGLCILHYPDPRLRAAAEPVEQITEPLRAIAAKMIALMHAANGVGLAATQLGVGVRLIVLRSLSEDFTRESEEEEEPQGLVFLNPVLIESEGYATEEEGCLSVPEVRAKIRRAKKVKVRVWDLEGQEQEIVSQGLLARAWQHEMDHLNGMLFIDKMSPASAIGNAKKLRELQLAHGET